MKVFARWSARICTLLVASLIPRSDLLAQSAKTVAALESEAEAVSKGELSKFFGWIRDCKNSERLGLSPVQVELVRRVDDLTREVIRQWLRQGLDAVQVSPESALLDRLSDRGLAHRARLTFHSEELVVHGVLTPAQSELVRKATGRRPGPILYAHDGPAELVVDAFDRPPQELVETLRTLTSRYQHSGLVAFVLLGRPGIRKLYPNGFGHLDPATKRIVSGQFPQVVVPEPQRELVEKIDTLVIDIDNAWARRGLDEHPQPSNEILANRLYWGFRFNENLACHAEILIMDGVLTPVQKDRCLISVWNELGYRALLDPALCSRLHIKKSQLAAIRDVLDWAQRADEELRGPITATLSPITQSAELQAEQDRYWTGNRLNKEQTEEMLWDILSPGQARALRQLVDCVTADNARPTKVRR